MSRVAHLNFTRARVWWIADVVRSRAMSASIALPQHRKSGCQGIRCLSLAGEISSANQIAQAVHHLGAEVVGAFVRPEQAFAALTSGERIDAAVLDIRRRGRGTFLLAEVLTALGAPFVFVTGSGPDLIPPEYRDVPCWEGPFDPQALAQALPLLGGHRDDTSIGERLGHGVASPGRQIIGRAWKWLARGGPIPWL